MSEEAVGSIVMSFNGLDYDVSRLGTSITTGNRPIPTMNRQQRVKYKSRGITTYELTATVVIPDGKDTVQWLQVDDARISIESPSGNYRETFIDCNVTSVGATYDMNGETVRELQLFCLDYIDETL
ncbi:hypothetical protein SAMN02799632_01803 [Acinetobacter pittii]|jgi:hypothetical protein|uniref:Phage tail protein n=3 Tax=Acinetobacter calcoaceticus/baumannii complex TaxID=909768 RepID=A0AAE9MBU6_ACIPI|nr:MULTISPECIES: hypothetical protein [Acinetobacter]AZP28907.1 hypothetical protein DLK06_07415 [Acinetobacter pittii]EXE92440.1 hypothetical protein J588_1081 [Acinetobacter sp. 1578804]KCX17885.1 hypothetical protein J723_0307 [Acinetobacter sp. 1264765]KQE15742.1 hypothetical protein APD38_15825 [Acinetobacter pittii]KQE29686.1 hypothetical protein APD39_14730 [Acinetobacter pittii]